MTHYCNICNGYTTFTNWLANIFPFIKQCKGCSTVTYLHEPKS